MPHKSKSPNEYRVILQQDAPEPMLRADVPKVTPDALLDYSVRQFESLPIDVYGSCANHAGGTYYNSKVSERMLSAPKTFRSQQDIRLADRLQSLFDAGTDPLKIYCKGVHAAGKDYMIRIRMNDLHDVVGRFFDLSKPNHHPEEIIGEPYYYTAQWKLDHPQCLIGDLTDETPPKSFQYWQRQAMNYALSQVRQYVYGMAEELVSGYDLDILELDFIRFAFYFRQAEAYAQRHVMTALVRRIRKLCDDVGQQRGRPVRLSARVPDTIELGLRSGIDTAEWLSQGLLDMVTIGGGYAPFGIAWQDIVSHAQKAGIPATACLNHGNFAKDLPRIRAAAHRAYRAGVCGLTLWNFWYCMDYYHPEGENPLTLDFVRELADPESLGTKALAYEADRIMDPDKFVGSTHFHHSWPGQMPMTIGTAEDGIGQCVTFKIPEASGGRKGSMEARLVLDISNFWQHDESLELLWNGELLPEVNYELRPNEGGEEYRLSCCLPCRKIISGQNLLELRLTKRDPRLDPFISLLRVELEIPDENGKLAPFNKEYVKEVF
ncbi:MAG: hypothetical protein KAT11_01550 [Phycisphaerae bacterium]|nr:hypothetical protein [Phycisphaerae bacterium]